MRQPAGFPGALEAAARNYVSMLFTRILKVAGEGKAVQERKGE